MATATLVNFNHLANLRFGAGWYVTVGVAMCCVLLFVVARVPLRESSGTPGYLYVGALLSYTLIGMAVGMLVGFPTLEFNLSRPVRPVVAALVVVASAAGATVLLKQAGVDALLRGIAFVLAATCCLILLTPLLQDYLYATDVYYRRYLSRWTGPFRDPNIAGLTACNAAVLGLTMLRGRSGRRLGTAVLILGIAATLLTYSRTAIVALVLAVGYFLVASTASQGRASGRARLWFVVALATVGGVAFYANIEHMPFKSPVERVASFSSAEAWGVPDKRFGLLVVALPRIADAWLTGSGLFSFGPMEGAPRCRGNVACSVHNSFLQFWGESGLIPLALLIGSLLLLLRARLRLRQHHAIDAVAGWLIVFVVGCLAFDNVPNFSWNAFLVGVSCALVSKLTLQERLSTKPLGSARPSAAPGSGAATEAPS